MANKFGGASLERPDRTQRGLATRNAENQERLRIIREKNLAVGDYVKLTLEDGDPLNGLICKIDFIEKYGSLRLYHQRFNTRRDNRATRTYDPSKVELHKKGS